MTENKTLQELSYLADDFFILILLEKSLGNIQNMGANNRALPWVSSHVLELSLKATCIHFKKQYFGHNLRNLWDQVKSKFNNQNIWPEPKYFEIYKKVFIPQENEQVISGLPIPDNLQRAELAYWIDNVTNLKYGIDKNDLMISTVHLGYVGLSKAFLDLFKGLRNTYKTEALNNRYRKQIEAKFTDPTHANNLIGLLI